MKTYVARAANLGTGVSVQEAADIAFGEGVLRKVHGPSVSVGPWDSQNFRTLCFAASMHGVPRLLRGLIGNSGEVAVVARQALARPRPDTIECHSVVSMQCLGSRFVSIRPQFTISREAKKDCEFEVRVQVEARLPFGIAGIAEAFMLRSARREVDVYVCAVREATASRPPPTPKTCRSHPLLSLLPTLPTLPMAFPSASPTAIPTGGAFRAWK